MGRAGGGTRPGHAHPVARSCTPTAARAPSCAHCPLAGAPARGVEPRGGVALRALESGCDVTISEVGEHLVATTGGLARRLGPQRRRGPLGAPCGSCRCWRTPAAARAGRANRRRVRAGRAGARGRTRDPGHGRRRPISTRRRGCSCSAAAASSTSRRCPPVPGATTGSASRRPCPPREREFTTSSPCSTVVTRSAGTRCACVTPRAAAASSRTSSWTSSRTRPRTRRCPSWPTPNRRSAAMLSSTSSPRRR